MGAESGDHDGAHGGAVFLSYASQDIDAARKLCEALRAAGVEVWFDQSELRGGEVWDHSIRRHIKTCTLKYMVDTSAGAEFQVAETYAYFGDKDKAFAWLDAAVERRDPGIQWLRGGPLLRSLTRDPRFGALLRRLNMPS
jgi:TIR domain